MPPLKSIEVHFFGDRLYPLGRFKLAEAQNGPLDQILLLAQQKSPTVTYEDLIRAIWVQGLHAVVKRLDEGERLEATTGRFAPAGPPPTAPTKAGPPPIPTAS